jgi:broad specificity phosphatase PhoE
VRHGETDWNAEARLQGQRDVPLNSFGRVQAEEAGARLRGLVPNYEGLDYVASPLGRARGTMELMRAAIFLPPESYRIDDRLKELSFGSWEGLTWKEVAPARRIGRPSAPGRNGLSFRPAGRATPCWPRGSRRPSPISPVMR